MRGKLTFVVGVAVGFVLGTRAGRERYEEMKDAAHKFLDSPSVHEATGVAQAQAQKLYERGKESFAASPLSDRLRHPMGHKDEVDPFLGDDTHQHMSSNSF